MTHVFVYGTLKTGFENHHFLAGQRLLGAANTVEGYTLFSLGDYPGMVRSSEPGRQVLGELWEVDDACLAALDELEGVAEGLFARVPVALQPPFASEGAEAYLYLRSLAGRRELGPAWPA
ncbi:MAG TPA: gamma-glutamylcyclotransferase family protein [Lacunisphaera sp.]|nr:gamma-glutamylcyclotransferase family protein [Lacunisphaera sp.]